MTKQTKKELPYRMISVAVAAVITILAWSVFWFFKGVR